MKCQKRLNAAGDTIIEVLIVLAVLGLAFAISAATATRALNRARNAEEHSQALGVLNAQVELVRQAVTQQTDVQLTVPFCMLAGATPKPFSFPAGSSAVPPDANQDTLTTTPPPPPSYPPSCVEGATIQYYKSVVFVPNAGDPFHGYFQFRVRWDGVGDLGKQQEEVVYRIQPIVNTGADFIEN